MEQCNAEIERGRRGYLPYVDASSKVREEEHSRCHEQEVVAGQGVGGWDVLVGICPGLVALGAPMHRPAAPTGPLYTQDQMEVTSSPSK
jgi:hypothetical protein